MQTGNVSIEPMHYLNGFGDTYQLEKLCSRVNK